MSTKKSLIIAACYTGILILGMIIGPKFHREDANAKNGAFLRLLSSSKDDKFDQVFGLIRDNYVDSVNVDSIQEHTIGQLLKNLDPHSSYMDPETAKLFTEDLDGSYQGIGLEYQIVRDTLLVTQLNAQGPAKRAGLKLGDKIIQIEGYNIAGVGVTSKKLQEMIRGRKGSSVNLSVRRKTSPEIISLQVNRDQIEVSSIEASYMLQPGIGYMRISKFGAKTDENFIDSLRLLKKEGLKSLVLDLRENGGGYLKSAIGLAEQFLGNKTLIVYTQGLHEPRTDFFASGQGAFKQGKLVVLIDENTASASEVFAGAIQDQDRGLIIGRRSFGKGLVQEQFNFGDGSTLNLTVARYYTPSGRSIQKSYKEGADSYYAEIARRYKLGELTTLEGHRADSLLNVGKPYKTHAGRLIYGGGGIMPDIFIPLDTVGKESVFVTLYKEGVISDFLYNHLARKKATDSISSFISTFSLDAKEYDVLTQLASQRGVKYGTEEWAYAKKYLSGEIKALYARYCFGDEGYYRVRNAGDEAIIKSLEVLREP